MIVDLRGVTFIDSYGLRILLELNAAAREGGFELTLIRAHGQVERVLRITGLDRLLPLEAPLGTFKEAKKA